MPQNTCNSATYTDIIKIATFNLFNYLEPPFAFYDFENIYSEEQWQKKQQWISDYLAEHQPDVIGFQEVFSPGSLQKLVAKQGYPYFAVVDEAELVDDYIYQSPVVAIASRFPIKSVEAVNAIPGQAKTMGLTDDFQFSRRPLRATIDFPHFGACDCYVVHFKSKRPAIDDATEKQESIIKALTNEITGSWASSIQRGSEAALLLTAIIERRSQSGYPILLMGDFNDNLEDGVLQHLQIGAIRNRGLADNNDFLLALYRLTDSWSLYQSAKQAVSDSDSPLNQRPFSYYFGSKGSVLDYIMLSCEFDTGYQESLAEVDGYHTYDRHLTNPIYERDSQSTDHAIIMVSLKVRS